MPGVTDKDRAHVEVTTYASVFRLISPGVVFGKRNIPKIGSRELHVEDAEVLHSCHVEEESPMCWR